MLRKWCSEVDAWCRKKKRTSSSPETPFTILTVTASAGAAITDGGVTGREVAPPTKGDGSADGAALPTSDRVSNMPRDGELCRFGCISLSVIGFSTGRDDASPAITSQDEAAAPTLGVALGV